MLEQEVELKSATSGVKALVELRLWDRTALMQHWQDEAATAPEASGKPLQVLIDEPHE